MRRTVLLILGMLPLALGMRLASPNVAAASSGKIIYSFGGGTDGAYPKSDLIMDVAGNLYGTTSQGGTVGGGTVFELTRTKDGWTHQVLYSFAGGSNDGAGPTAGLVFDSVGNLYGTTAGGGSSNCGCGTVFKLAQNSHGGWTESILYSFTGSNGDGANPNTDLVFDSKGNLYGTTSGGEYTGFGVVFKLSPNSGGTWTESTVYSFQGPPNDGAFPIGGLLVDSGGNLYGATEGGGNVGNAVCNGGTMGGTNGCGAVFKLTPASGGGWRESVLYNFFRGQGFAKRPSGGLILENPDQILGTTSVGGDGDGAFFRLDQTKKGWEQNLLYRFYGDPDGRNPVGRLAQGPGGQVYGATSNGGKNAASYGGTVFEVEQINGQWKEHVLLNANGDFCNPQAGPIVDSRGRVYGTSSGGASGCENYGVVYEIVP